MNDMVATVVGAVAVPLATGLGLRYLGPADPATMAKRAVIAHAVVGAGAYFVSKQMRGNGKHVALGGAYGSAAGAAFVAAAPQGPFTTPAKGSISGVVFGALPSDTVCALKRYYGME